MLLLAFNHLNDGLRGDLCLWLDFALWLFRCLLKWFFYFFFNFWLLSHFNYGFLFLFSLLFRLLFSLRLFSLLYCLKFGLFCFRSSLNFGLFFSVFHNNWEAFVNINNLGFKDLRVMECCYGSWNLVYQG